MWPALAGAEGDKLDGLTTHLSVEKGQPNQDNYFFAARASLEKMDEFCC
jgi:hypothetical protein